MNPKIYICLMTLPLAFPALAQDNKEKDAPSSGLMLELDKDQLGESAGQIMFVPKKSAETGGNKTEGEAKAKIEYQGYKHKHMEKYGSIAEGKGFYKSGWLDDCRKDEKCKSKVWSEADGKKGGSGETAGKADDKSSAESGAKKSAEKIQKIASKLAFLKSAKNELKKKQKSDGSADAKSSCAAAEKLIDKDLKKVMDEAKKSNDSYGVPIFDLEKAASEEEGQSNNPSK